MHILNSRYLLLFVFVVAFELFVGARPCLADADWSVCAKDMEKFCKGVPLGHGREAVCLQQNLRRLSYACRSLFKQAVKLDEKFFKHCEADVKRFCAHVSAEEATEKSGWQKCLKRQDKRKLSRSCRMVVKQYPGTN